LKVVISAANGGFQIIHPSPSVSGALASQLSPRNASQFATGLQNHPIESICEQH
jgi:hypothetical protein